MGYERDLLKGLGIFCYNTYIYLGEPILILSLNPPIVDLKIDENCCKQMLASLP